MGDSPPTQPLGRPLRPGRGIADGLPPAIPTAATASEQRSGAD